MRALRWHFRPETHPRAAGLRSIEPAASATRCQRSKDSLPAPTDNVHSQYARALYKNATASRVKVARFHPAETGPPCFIKQLSEKNGRISILATSSWPPAAFINACQANPKNTAKIVILQLFSTRSLRPRRVAPREGCLASLAAACAKVTLELASPIRKLSGEIH